MGLRYENKVWNNYTKTKIYLLSKLLTILLEVPNFLDVLWSLFMNREGEREP